MFDKIKKLQQLKKIKDSLSQEKIEIEKEGVELIMNGNLEVEELKLNSDLSKENQERIAKECFNEGVKKVQLKMAERFKGLI